MAVQPGFTPSRTGIGEMLAADFMVIAMTERAVAVAERAQQLAPVYENGPHPGRYKAAFAITAGVRKHKSTRAFGRVSNSAPEALAVEFGTKNNPARHVLVKALDAVGGISGSAVVARRDGGGAARQAVRVKRQKRNAAARARRAARAES